MDTQPTLESLIRSILTPIINDAVAQAITRHFSAPTKEPQEALPEFLDVKQAAKFLHISVPTIYGYVHTRSIPYYKRYQRLTFKRVELEQWLNSGRRMTEDEIREAARESLGHYRKR